MLTSSNAICFSCSDPDGFPRGKYCSSFVDERDYITLFDLIDSHVRQRVNQEETLEECMAQIASGTATRSPKKRMSISMLSNEQVRDVNIHVQDFHSRLIELSAHRFARIAYWKL